MIERWVLLPSLNLESEGNFYYLRIFWFGSENNHTHPFLLCGLLVSIHTFSSSFQSCNPVAGLIYVWVLWWIPLINSLWVRDKPHICLIQSNSETKARQSPMFVFWTRTHARIFNLHTSFQVFGVRPLSLETGSLQWMFFFNLFHSISWLAIYIFGLLTFTLDKIVYT